MLKYLFKRFALLLLAAVVMLPVFAAIEEIEFADDEQKARYQALIAELRCPMCLNSNLAGSDAPIAAGCHCVALVCTAAVAAGGLLHHAAYAQQPAPTGGRAGQPE